MSKLDNLKLIDQERYCLWVAIRDHYGSLVKAKPSPEIQAQIKICLEVIRKLKELIDRNII